VGEPMAKLIFRYGSMNASKSAQLIMDNFGHNQNGKDTIVFRPSLDTRSDKVSSRALDTEITAIPVKPEDVDLMFDMVMNNFPRIVFVDEVQFFTPKQIEELARIVDVIGVTVQAYGLMTTFKGELFEGSKRLVELADVVERIRSECTRCDREGIMNARFVDGKFQSDGETVVVGKEESYRVLCRKCFLKEKNKNG
jgi:thymidine kinase